MNPEEFKNHILNKREVKQAPLPCPFCGNKEIIFMHQIRGKAYVCGTCMAQTADTYCVQTQEDALKAWNMRKWVPEKIINQ